MNYQELYQSKIRSPEEAVSFIKSGCRVYTGGNPGVLYQALYENRENLRNVEIYAQFGMMGKSGEFMLGPDMADHITFATTVTGFRNAGMPGNVDQISLSFSGMERLIEVRVKPDVVLLSGCPMDADGYINLGFNHGCTRIAVDLGAKTVVQIKKDMCVANTDYYRVHISEVDALVEADNPPEAPFRIDRAFGEEEDKIAAYVVERVANGATLQLGAGGVSGATGAYFKDHKNLGLHAETLVDTLIPLMESGVINNSRKPVLPGVSVAGFITAGDDALRYLDNNPAVMLKKLAWVNDPQVIRQIPNMVSINACLATDLRGQVCAESLAMGNTGGIGGQLDFVEGARMSPGGQSFLVMHASATPKNGEKISKITFALPTGSVVTTPASDVMNIVTEYGVAELYRKSARERARNLIRIADPEFRDSLTFEARKAGLI